MVKLQDIADEAGVAVSTVSSTLNGKGRISHKCRAEIMAVATRLGYRPNLAAKLLKSRESRVIGLVIAQAPRTLAGNGVYSEVVSELVEECYANDWHPHFELFDPEEAEGQGSIPAMFTDGLAAGCVFGGYMSASVRQWLSDHPDFPVVTFGEPWNYSVRAEHVRGTHDAMQYLVATGHRKISLICGPRRFDIHGQSIQGYEKAAADFALPMTASSILEQKNTQLELHDCENLAFLDRLFDGDDPPDALILAGRRLTSTALYHLQRKGILVPEDVSIIGIMSDWEASSLYPGITAIEQDLPGMTSAALRILIQRIRSKTIRQPNVSIESRLVHRHSTMLRNHT